MLSTARLVKIPSDCFYAECTQTTASKPDEVGFAVGCWWSDTSVNVAMASLKLRRIMLVCVTYFYHKPYEVHFVQQVSL